MSAHSTVRATAKSNLLATIGPMGRAKIVEVGTHLFEQDDECNGVYLLESGLIGLRKLNEDGTTMLVNLARSGDFLGYAPLLTDGEHVAGAEVLQTSRVIFFDLATMRRMIRDIPELIPALLRQATRDLARLEDMHVQMATQQAHVRLAALLLSFNQEANRSSCSFTLPLMNKDLADLIGIRPETLSRAIGQLRSAGLAELRGHTVNIPSVANLARLGRCCGSSALAA